MNLSIYFRHRKMTASVELANNQYKLPSSLKNYFIQFINEFYLQFIIILKRGAGIIL